MADLVEKLISSIVAVLNKIADNTAPVEKIYAALSEYLGNKSPASPSTKLGLFL